MNSTSLTASELRSLRVLALRAWQQADPRAKCEAALCLAAPFAGLSGVEVDPRASELDDAPPDVDRALIALDGALNDPPLRPGRPARPLLVHPREVADRGVGSEAGRAALLHAIAHIEFNAIDLALDAIWRFADMPESWVRDWARVAVDEARHFSLLQAELERRGYSYGDFPAHDGLWEMALRTRHDVLLRVALVPRLLEARGLDVTPRIIERLRGAGDRRAIGILELILREEVVHVAIGNDWFHRLCQERGLDPVADWDALAAANAVATPAPPFNRAARLQAGFVEPELQRWEARARRPDL
ncbi:MAG: hypothetical protein RLZ51_1713 [Pseudomonadota bacterium]|jgi:uncharacterized ferritin-like protein (DUF455 family)